MNAGYGSCIDFRKRRERRLARGRCGRRRFSDCRRPRSYPAPPPLFCCIFVVNHSPWPCATSSGPLHTTAHPSPCHPPARPVASHVLAVLCLRTAPCFTSNTEYTPFSKAYTPVVFSFFLQVAIPDNNFDLWLDLVLSKLVDWKNKMDELHTASKSKWQNEVFVVQIWDHTGFPLSYSLFPYFHVKVNIYYGFVDILHIHYYLHCQRFKIH